MPYMICLHRTLVPVSHITSVFVPHAPFVLNWHFVLPELKLSECCAVCFIASVAVEYLLPLHNAMDFVTLQFIDCVACTNFQNNLCNLTPIYEGTKA